MWWNTRAAPYAAVCLGIATGAWWGIVGDGWVVPACVLGLLWPLADARATPSRAAWQLGAFALGLFTAGHAGFIPGVPQGLRLLAALPLVALVLAHCLVAAAFGYVGFRCCTSPAARVTLAVPSLWVLQEWLFSLPDSAVPWIRLGYSQAATGPFGVVLPLGGVLLGGWVVLSACGALALACRSRRTALRLRWLGVAMLPWCIGVVASSVDWTESSGSLTVDLVQSGIPSKDKFDDRAAGKILALYDGALRSSSADLIVTSQLSIPKTEEALPVGYLARLQDDLQHERRDALLGLYIDGGPAQLFNGVVALGQSGVQRYLKHRVFPFGETIPFGGRARDWVQSRLPAPLLDTASGPLPSEPLRVGTHRAALAICFEAAFGDIWRVAAQTADLLVNVSSDSAIDSSQLRRQFRRVDQARALELRKPLLRTSDVHGTYVIDAAGRIAVEVPGGRHETARAVVHTRVGPTPYARFGDRLAMLVCVVGLGIALALSRWTAGPARVPRFSESAPAARPSPQAGQVLPAAAVLLLIVGGMFYLMVNAGQAVTEKIRVTNAADAAAYSAGVVEARALNYDAYLNRAMVANEIALAQMVSFASWVNYFATAADNIGGSAGDLNFFLLPNPQVAVLDVAFGGSELAARYFGARTVQDYVDYIVRGAGAIVTWHDLAVNALSLSQQAVHANLLAGVRQGQIANRVVKAMDPALRAEVVLATHGFDTFTKNYGRRTGAGDLRGRFADVTMRSRDPFTRERNWTIDSFDIPLLRNDPALKKRGGTELRGFDEWRAVDTLELHGQRFGCGRFGLSWCDDIRRPIGWGAVEVDAGGADRGAGYHGNAYSENPTTAQRADSAMTTPQYASFSGIPDSREIADVDPRHEVSTGITIRVVKSQADTLTSGNAALATPSGRMAVFNDHPAAGRMAALSRAQVFFDRIASRADGKEEIGSLYNPYWRVRLVAATAADKAYAATRQAGLVLP